MTALLETHMLSKSFGALRATRDVTFALGKARGMR